MGVMEFRWELLPNDLLSLVRADLDSDSLPTEATARSLWRGVRDQWLLSDTGRCSRFAALLDALEVGRTSRGRATDDSDFLRNVRNTSGLRHALVRYLIALGSPDPGPSDDPAEMAAAPDRVYQNDTTGEGASTTLAAIPSSDFAPRNPADFARLMGMNDLQWGLFTMQLFNAVMRLLPGESLAVRAVVDDVANDGRSQGSVGASIARQATGDLFLVLTPEPLLPRGSGYGVLAPALAELGWAVDDDGIPFGMLPWPDGADDAVGIVVQTLRTVFLVDSPVRMEQSDEIRPPGGLLPAAPAPGDVVQPESPEELLQVAASIVRAVDGAVFGGADPLTSAIRLGPWTGWIHVEATAPLLDVVLVVADFVANPGLRMEPAQVVALQSSGMRFGRLVMTETQAVVAATVPLHAFTGKMVEAVLIGLIEDASRALGLAQPSTPLVPGLGGYL